MSTTTTNTINRSDIGTLHTPPENQGQIIEVSYAWLQDGSSTVVRREYDRSTRTEAWSTADGSDIPEGHLCNGVPGVSEWTPARVR